MQKNSLLLTTTLALLVILLSSVSALSSTGPGIQHSASVQQSTGAVSALTNWRRSPVWTGNIDGPQDEQGRAWYELSFDDSSWSTLSLPDTGPDNDGDDRYYRANFSWDGSSDLYLSLSSDDGMAIYINGELMDRYGNGWRKLGCVNRPDGCELVNWAPPQKIPAEMLSDTSENLIAIDLWNAACTSDQQCEYYLNITLEAQDPDAPTETVPPSTASATPTQLTTTPATATPAKAALTHTATPTQLTTTPVTATPAKAASTPGITATPLSGSLTPTPDAGPTTEHILYLPAIRHR